MDGWMNGLDEWCWLWVFVLDCVVLCCVVLCCVVLCCVVLCCTVISCCIEFAYIEGNKYSVEYITCYQAGALRTNIQRVSNPVQQRR